MEQPIHSKVSGGKIPETISAVTQEANDRCHDLVTKIEGAISALDARLFGERPMDAEAGEVKRDSAFSRDGALGRAHVSALDLLARLRRVSDRLGSIIDEI
jgi:hypothetical protein